MCGIVGIHGDQRPELIQTMLDIIFHRGPDSGGVFEEPDRQLAIGMRRLAIIDIADGAQPMSTEDGRLTIVFNGEIFNAPALRAALEKHGVIFKTNHSDTEVLLHLYRKHGTAMLEKLNGMFAFAIYDSENNHLFCARDHAGIKPFYYLHNGSHFCFASELKALLSFPFSGADICRDKLFDFMSLMYVPGEETIIAGIKRLPAGSYLIYDLNKKTCDIRKWWSPDFKAQIVSDSRTELCAQIRAQLAEAVSRWSMSDVPIACSLSGGLDSSAIVGLLSQAGASVSTYSLGFTGGDEGQWNELPEARAVADKWHTRHHEIVLSPEVLIEQLLEMVWHLDEPYAGGLPSWSVFSKISADYKVVMTGTGGDELFGNYGKWRYLEGRFLKRTARESVSPKQFKSNFFERYYYASDAQKRQDIFQEWANHSPDTCDYLWRHYSEANSSRLRDGVTGVDLNTQLPEEFLMMTDRFSMAHSLEARTPFLDRAFMEFMLSIPAHHRTSRNDLKGLLRESIADLLPSRNLQAPKKGFVMPLTLWLRGKLKPLVEELLAADRLATQGLFKPGFYTMFVQPHLRGHADYTNKVWAALMFQLWHFVYIEQKSFARPLKHNLVNVPVL